MKTCNTCNLEKPLDEFHKLTRSKDGRCNKCKACRKAEVVVYYRDNKEKISYRGKEYYKKNTKNIKERVNRYRVANFDKVRERKQLWISNNRERHNAYKLKYEKERLKSDPAYKLARRLRKRLRAVLRSSGAAAITLLGCTPDKLRLHLEKQFLPGMSWSNYSFHGWHVDHKIALSSVNLLDPAELARVCHYTNLQPLWCLDNLRKWKRSVV